MREGLLANHSVYPIVRAEIAIPQGVAKRPRDGWAIRIDDLPKATPEPDWEMAVSSVF